MKIIAFLLCLLPLAVSAQPLDEGKARGLFLSAAIGPRIPVSEFASRHSLGFGINMELSYTDNEYLPLFLYARAGYENYPGSTDFYRRSDYSSLTAHVIPVSIGAKLFLPPLVQDIVILIPTFELGASFAFFEKSHQFKIGSGRSGFLEDDSKFGFHAGAGFSMFLIELMGTYNYFPDNESLAADLRVRIPIFIKL